MPKESAQDHLRKFFESQKKEIESEKVQKTECETDAAEHDWAELINQLNRHSDDWNDIDIYALVRKTRELIIKYPGRFQCPHCIQTMPESHGMMTDRFMVCEICGELVD